MSSIRHHDLDIYPIPREVHFINEPEIAGSFCSGGVDNNCTTGKEPPKQDDNIRIYVPIDLNHESLLAYLDAVISTFKEVNWKNESAFSSAVDGLLMRVEIYDQVWRAREMSRKNAKATDELNSTRHSARATAVIKEMIARMEEVNSCEDFPENFIEKLRSEYGL